MLWALASWRGLPLISQFAVMIHHLFAAGGEAITLECGAAGQKVAVLMLSEYTTPLLHILYVLERARYLGKNLITIGLCSFMLIQWIVFRLGVSVYFALYDIWFWDALMQLPIFQIIVCLSVSVFFNVINFYWFYKLIRKGQRLVAKSRMAKKSA
jgi:hypothetical protein